jgi:hypothetical protein
MLSYLIILLVDAFHDVASLDVDTYFYHTEL